MLLPIPGNSRNPASPLAAYRSAILSGHSSTVHAAFYLNFARIGPMAAKFSIKLSGTYNIPKISINRFFSILGRSVKEFSVSSKNVFT
jgi:hypothetical protein